MVVSCALLKFPAKSDDVGGIFGDVASNGTICVSIKSNPSGDESWKLNMAGKKKPNWISRHLNTTQSQPGTYMFKEENYQQQISTWLRKNKGAVHNFYSMCTCRSVRSHVQKRDSCAFYASTASFISDWSRNGWIVKIDDCTFKVPLRFVHFVPPSVFNACILCKSYCCLNICSFRVPRGFCQSQLLFQIRKCW